MDNNKIEGIDQAVITLSDEIFELENNLEKACILSQELSEEYFQKFDREIEKYGLGILWEFARYKIYSEMINDYVCAAKLVIDKLRKIEERYYDEKEKLKVVETEQETA